MRPQRVAPRECLLQLAIGDVEIDRVRRERPVGARGPAVAQGFDFTDIALREAKLDARADERVTLAGIAGGFGAAAFDARLSYQHAKAETNQGIELVIYRDLSTNPQTLTYHFTSDELSMLQQYSADGRFALGFDPHCHFYNDGVSLKVTTQACAIPLPAAAGLFFPGAALAAWITRRWNAGTPQA